jgi:hypothetical protein
MIKRCMVFAVLLSGLVPAVSLAQQQPMRMAMRQAAGIKIDLKNDAGSRVLTVRLGPLDLPAHQTHHEIAQSPNEFFTIPFDGWLTAYHPQLTDAAGRRLPNRLLHHVAFFNTARADFLCPQKPEHIFGAGGEMNDWPDQPGFGYRVHQGDRILVSTMFHNETARNYPQVFLEVEMDYQPASASGPKLKNVYPAWFDVKGCGPSGYDLTPGRNVTSDQFTLGYSGKLIGVGGHLHDYGRTLILEDSTHNQTIATLAAKLNAQYQMVSIPVKLFTRSGGYPLKKGQVVKVTAIYDNPTGKPIPEGAMGIAVGYFLPDSDAEMNALARHP